MRILLVEDNAELAGHIVRRIRSDGFVIDRVGSIDEAKQAVEDEAYALMLLDRRLPDGDGLSFVPFIRYRRPGVRIMVLTALDAIDNRIEGLDAGADDYLTKPFNLDELMARIRASLRRPGGERAPPVVIGGLHYDMDTRSATTGGLPVPLLRRELALLDTLVRRAGRVVPRDALIAAIYELEEDIQPHTLTTLVCRLRSRLDEARAGVKIHSSRGLGYMIMSAEI
jgi:two-component system, OmpR family, response regulator